MITIREAVRITSAAKENKQKKDLEKYEGEIKFISNLITQRVSVQAAIGKTSTLIVLRKRDCENFELKNIIDATLTLKQEHVIIKEVNKVGGTFHILLNWGGTQ